MEEREFFDERPEKKVATLNCPHCQQAAEYEISWLVRTKKNQLSGRADERDRARFAKAKSYMLRIRMTETERLLLEEAAKSKSLETSTWARSELIALAKRLLSKK